MYNRHGCGGFSRRDAVCGVSYMGARLLAFPAPRIAGEAGRLSCGFVFVASQKHVTMLSLRPSFFPEQVLFV